MTVPPIRITPARTAAVTDARFGLILKILNVAYASAK
jgi:hypothetical protein